MERVPESPSHDEVNAALHEFHARQTEMDWAIGEWLIAADERKVHVRFGASSFCEYAGGIFGWNWRQALQRLDTAKRLRELPMLSDRLRDGKLAWSAVREVARVATAETEAEWLMSIEGKTIREIEPLVAGHEEGDRPDDEKDPNKEIRRVVLAFTLEKYERFLRAIVSARADLDEFAEDADIVLQKLEEKAAERTGDGSRSRSQLLYMRTLDTGKTYVASAGGLEPVSAETAELLDCDSVQIAPSGVGAAGGKATQTIKPSVRRFCMARAGGRCQVPGCRSMHFLDIHHLLLRMFGGTGDPENLIVLCGYHHRAFHNGWLLIDGSWEKGFLFRHVTGKIYGSKDTPSLLRHANGVLAQLKDDGYPEHHARAVLDEVWPLMEAGILTLYDLDIAASNYLPAAEIRRLGLPPDEEGNTTATFTSPAHVGSVDPIEALDELRKKNGVELSPRASG